MDDNFLVGDVHGRAPTSEGPMSYWSWQHILQGPECAKGKQHEMFDGESCIIKPLSLVETCMNFSNMTLFQFYRDQTSVYQIIWNASIFEVIITL